MANVKINDDVLDILKRSTITDNSLILPPEQLERKMYEAVNKAITAAGGKWNTKAKAHLFQSDPRERLGLALEKGVVIDEKKKFQSFFTPSTLASHVAEIADVEGHVVLEPSAGNGALADACIKAGAKDVHCCDINPECVTELRKTYKVVEEYDFLKYPFDLNQKYKRIVMNPPFTKNQDVKHVKHALKILSDDGILVAIMSGNTERKQFEELVEYLDYTIEEVPAGTFKESGTNIATIILTVFKH